MMKLAAADFRKGAGSIRNGNLQRQTLKHLEMAADVQSWDQMTRARVGGVFHRLRDVPAVSQCYEQMLLDCRLYLQARRCDRSAASFSTCATAIVSQVK